MNDIEATDKDIAAGGKNSVKNEYGVSDPYAIGAKKAVSTAQLLAKINRIEAISLKARAPPARPCTRMPARAWSCRRATGRAPPASPESFPSSIFRRGFVAASCCRPYSD